MDTTDEIRPTEDVDIIIELASAAKYSVFSEKVLGFSNMYYKDGFKNKEKISLPNGEEVYILPYAYFLATKLEAFENRGKNDPRFSKDLEDTVALLAEPKNFESIYMYDELVAKTLRPNFAKLFSNESIVEAMRGFLQGSASGQFNVLKERAKLVKD